MAKKQAKYDILSDIGQAFEGMYDIVSGNIFDPPGEDDGEETTADVRPERERVKRDTFKSAPTKKGKAPRVEEPDDGDDEPEPEPPKKKKAEEPSA